VSAQDHLLVDRVVTREVVSAEVGHGEENDDLNGPGIGKRGGRSADGGHTEVW
jgi:hypothetical protein